MGPTVKQRAMSILADSVQVVLGPDNLACVAVKRAASVDTQKNYTWAEQTFNQIAPSERAEIRETAHDKAHSEMRAKRKGKMKVVPAQAPAKKAPADVQVADMRKLFGG